MPPKLGIEAMDLPTILYISYGECATDVPLCVRQPKSFKKTPFFSQRLL